MDAAKVQFLTKDLPYELDMLDAAIKYLKSDEFTNSADTTDRATWFRRNAAIEAFWVHARNIIEFLTRAKTDGVTASSCSAKDFVDFDCALDKNRVIRSKINEQVSHLGFGRKASPYDKLGADTMIWLKPAIDSEIARFEKLLLLETEHRKLSVERRAAKELVLTNLTATTSSTDSMKVIVLDGYPPSR
jgi:hypothetical protein